MNLSAFNRDIISGAAIQLKNALCSLRLWEIGRQFSASLWFSLSPWLSTITFTLPHQVTLGIQSAAPGKVFLEPIKNINSRRRCLEAMHWSITYCSSCNSLHVSSEHALSTGCITLSGSSWFNICCLWGEKWGMWFVFVTIWQPVRVLSPRSGESGKQAHFVVKSNHWLFI